MICQNNNILLLAISYKYFDNESRIIKDYIISSYFIKY